MCEVRRALIELLHLATTVVLVLAVAWLCGQIWQLNDEFSQGVRHAAAATK